MNNEQARIRLGKVTASRFGDVMGSRAAWISYARQIREEIETLRAGSEAIDEHINGFPQAASLAWGHRHEDQARAEYELRHDVDVAVPGFREHVMHPWCGGSPDGLVRAYGGIEIKCPWSEAVHINTLAHGISDEHRAQVQGNIWINDLAWMDFISYDPRRNSGSDYYEQRVLRDHDYITRLELRVVEFWAFVMSGADDPVGAFKDASDFGLANLPALF